MAHESEGHLASQTQLLFASEQLFYVKSIE